MIVRKTGLISQGTPGTIATDRTHHHRSRPSHFSHLSHFCPPVPPNRELRMNLKQRPKRNPGSNHRREGREREFQGAGSENDRFGLTCQTRILPSTNGAQTPFGHRWGGDVFALTHSHIETIQQGQTLALDVMGEYVVFLKQEKGGRGYGG